MVKHKPRLQASPRRTSTSTSSTRSPACVRPPKTQLSSCVLFSAGRLHTRRIPAGERRRDGVTHRIVARQLRQAVHAAVIHCRRGTAELARTSARCSTCHCGSIVCVPKAFKFAYITPRRSDSTARTRRIIDPSRTWPSFPNFSNE